MIYIFTYFKPPVDVNILHYIKLNENKNKNKQTSFLLGIQESLYFNDKKNPGNIASKKNEFFKK